MSNLSELITKCKTNPDRGEPEALEFLKEHKIIDTSKNFGDYHITYKTKSPYQKWESKVYCVEGDYNPEAIPIFRDVRDYFEKKYDTKFVDRGGFNFTSDLSTRDGLGYGKAWCSSNPNAVMRTSKILNSNDIIVKLNTPEVKACNLIKNFDPEEIGVDINYTHPRISEIKGFIPEKSSNVLIPISDLPQNIINKIKIEIKKDDKYMSYKEKIFDPNLHREKEFTRYLLRMKKIDDKWYYVFPVGLSGNADKFFKDKLGLDLKIDDRRELPPPHKVRMVKTLNGKELKLRDYQKEIVDEAIKKGSGLIELATGGGKTFIAANIIAKIAEHEGKEGGYDTSFLVPNISLFYNAADQLRSYFDPDDVNIGQIGGEKVDLKDDPNKVDINIISIPLAARVFGGSKDTSPEKEKAIKRAFEMSPVTIVDEVHHLPADTFKKVMKENPAKFRFGLSATPYRTDGKDLEITAGVGDKIGQIKAMDLVKMGYLTPPRIEIIDVSKTDPIYDRQVIERLAPKDGDYSFCFDTLTKTMKAYIKANRLPRRGSSKQHLIRKATTMCNPERNEIILDLVKTLTDKGKNTVVFVNYTDHGKFLANKLKERGVSAELLTGVTESKIEKTEEEERKIAEKTLELRKNRDLIFNRMRNGKLRSIIATGQIMGEGVDIPAIDALILADEGKSKVNVVQRIGRALRLKEGKKEALIFDFKDGYAKYLSDWSKERINIYQKEGFPYEDTTYENLKKKLEKLVDSTKTKNNRKEKIRKTPELQMKQTKWMELFLYKTPELKKIASEIRKRNPNAAPYSKLRKSELIEYIMKYNN